MVPCIFHIYSDVYFLAIRDLYKLHVKLITVAIVGYVAVEFNQL